jgi:4-hydroxythreonine-4-phosphate dehydrogenase
MKPLVISMGDAAGTGPEIILKALAEWPADLGTCVVLGDVAAMRRAKSLPGLAELPLALAELHSLDDAAALPPACVGVVQACTPFDLPAFGQVSPAAGLAAAQSIAAGAQAALEGRAAALVTAPIHKAALAAAGLPWSQFPGHTELLQAEAARWTGQPVADMPVRMMLANLELRTVLVSIHLSLRQALDRVTVPRVLETLRITHASLSLALGRAPRMAVAGLNPHAGEAGLFGREELEIIGPAIEAAQAEGMRVSGPHPPDTIFMRARAQAGQPDGFDVVIAMYHDQGLIPVKYLGLEHGVNVTLGLPFLRTSPDHGTAFDLAGTGRAHASSLLAAMRLARQWSDRAVSPGRVP